MRSRVNYGVLMQIRTWLRLWELCPREKWFEIWWDTLRYVEMEIGKEPIRTSEFHQNLNRSQFELHFLNSPQTGSTTFQRQWTHSRSGNCIVHLLWVKERFWQSIFGVSPTICDQLWEEIQHHSPQTSPQDLLRVLYFLKNYSLENAAIQLWNIFKQTYHNHLWQTLSCLNEYLNNVTQFLLLSCFERAS
jgi:hypothetical protein